MQASIPGLVNADPEKHGAEKDEPGAPSAACADAACEGSRRDPHDHPLLLSHRTATIGRNGRSLYRALLVITEPLRSWAGSDADRPQKLARGDSGTERPATWEWIVDLRRNVRVPVRRP